MRNKKTKFDDIQVDSNMTDSQLSDNSSVLCNPSSIPLIYYQRIFQHLPIQSLISVSLTCETWYNILSSDTKLMLLNGNQLISVSNSKMIFFFQFMFRLNKLFDFKRTQRKIKDNIISYQSH
jgi:hypothetical protein